jgi:hypothetical protein
VIINDAGEITAGTWNGTAIAVAYGGTGTATPSIVAGTNVTVTGSWPNQTINASGGGGGSGTVTDMSIVSANGLAGTVATSTTTPAVTLSTTVTGVVKGNGTALSAATAGTDYVAPGGALGTPSSGTATNLTGLPLTTGVTGLLPVANGGTGTATPAIVAGTNVTVSGTWPNQTINATAGGSGTVTSVGGTGTVNGITLTGTVTTSGNLTLGGTLDLSSPPAIGGTTAAAVTGTVVTASTKVVTPYVDAVGSGGGQLRNASGTSQLAWGAGGGSNLTLEVATNINPANAAVSIAPTGTGTVTINPATAGTMNNMAIGGTTPAAGAFTTVTASTAIGVASGGTGASSLTANNVLLGNGTSAFQVVAPSTAGNVLTSNGTTWQSTAPAASGLTRAQATAISLVFGF